MTIFSSFLNCLAAFWGFGDVAAVFAQTILEYFAEITLFAAHRVVTEIRWLFAVIKCRWPMPTATTMRIVMSLL